MKEKIRKLFVEKKKTPFEISEIFKISQEEVRQILAEYGFTSISDRKYYILKSVPLLKEQREFICGCLLGNGHLKKYGKRSQYYLYIEEKNKNVILWKKYHLSNYINVISQNKSKNWQCQTVDNTELTSFHKKFYDNNKKIIKDQISQYISSLSLAVLFVDRGQIQLAQTIKFQTSNFSKQEHEILQNIFKINFGINSKICTFIRNDLEYHYLSLNKRNTEIFMNLINPFISEILRD